MEQRGDVSLADVDQQEQRQTENNCELYEMRIMKTYGRSSTEQSFRSNNDRSSTQPRRI